MEYQLKDLELMISELLYPNNGNQQKLTKEFLSRSLVKIKTETERIKHSLEVQSISFLRESKKLKKHIRVHQNAICLLLDRLYDFKWPAGTVTLSGNICNQVESLYAFLKLKFSSSFDFDGRLPDLYKRKLQTDFKEYLKLTVIQQEEDLFKLFKSEIEDYLFSHLPLNHRQAKFLERLMENHISGNTLMDYLLSLNFNNRRFFEYYIDQLKVRASEEKTETDLIVFFVYQIKLLNQLTFQSELYWDAHLPRIKDQILTWITEEIYYLERKQELQILQPETANKPSSPAAKVQTSLSVAHLSLAVKLLVDTGVIKNKNATELMRIVSRNFKTERMEIISEDSLRNKSYNYESRTIDGMKDVILGLLNRVMKY